MDFKKDIFVYILSVGLAFYGGMKLKQLERLYTVKVGTLIVEFQDNKCGFKKPVIRNTTKPKINPTPETIKVPPKTDVEKVLEPEKITASDPNGKGYDPYAGIQEIEECYYKVELIDSKKDQWDRVKAYKACVVLELTSNNCNYIDEKTEIDFCKNEQKKEASRLASAYDKRLDRLNGNKGFYGNIKEKVKEALEENQNENTQ